MDYFLLCNVTVMGVNCLIYPSNGDKCRFILL